MNKQKKGFSFIEIIVVVTLLSLVTFSGSYYFQDFIQKQEISIYMNNINQKIIQLDKQVKNKEIFDYKINIENNFLQISKNNFGVDNPLVFTKNINNGIYNLETLDSQKILNYTVFKDTKKISQENISGDKIINISLDKNYILESYLNNIPLNIQEIYQYSNNETMEVYQIIDNSNLVINSLEIYNIGGKKIYKNNSNGDILDIPIDIHFSLYGFESILTLED